MFAGTIHLLHLISSKSVDTLSRHNYGDDTISLYTGSPDLWNVYILRPITIVDSFYRI